MTIGHAKISAGVEGVDEVLDGGFIPNRAYMVRGGAGTGKTTLGLHFLTAAVNPACSLALRNPAARSAQTLSRRDLTSAISGRSTWLRPRMHSSNPSPTT